MEEKIKSENTPKTDNKPWLWKKGFCPNPGGRPKGKSLKAYAGEYLSKLTDEEKDEWLEGLSKDKVWTMGEGNPDTKTDITTKGEKINITPEVLKVATEYEKKLNELEDGK
jgi:hypothetical protein